MVYITKKHRKELKGHGFTVVKQVVPESHCDSWVHEYHQWLSQFEDGEWPFTAHSLLQRYNTGNLETTWKARLSTKKVFSELWGTEKLLTSIDAIAIGRPPETSEEDFASPGKHWLHSDQDATRKGLHAYQGGLYLEHAEEDDWTFHVLKGSHTFLDEFYESNQNAALRSSLNKYYHMRDENIEWFKNKGCETVRVSVPKGGMVLWDSRLIHANARPLKGRNNPGRWRFVVLVCMAPAIWAPKDDIERKQEAYNSLSMTTHWPSQGVNSMKSEIPSYCRRDVKIPTNHCEIAKTKATKQLCGVVPYDFEDGLSNGPDWTPEWDKNHGIHTKSNHASNSFYLKLLALSLLLALFAYIVTFL